MINLFVKKLIKDYDKTTLPHVRTAYGKFASYFGILLNILLFAIKIVIGTLCGSVAISADAVNNLSDASSSIISLIGFKMADKPADEDHPYGHGRYEYISGLMVAVLILVIGIELLKSSIDKIFNPSAVEFSLLSAGVLVVSIILKLWMMCFNRKIGKLIESGTLYATAVDSRNDVIATAAVLAALTISQFIPFDLDGYMGVAVAVFILINGFGLIKDTISPMLGEAPDAEFVEKIRQKILTYPGVLGTHDLMIHDYGPGRKFASVHVEMSSKDDVIESHDVIDNIERYFFENENLHLVVHYDPIVTDDEEVTQIRLWIANEITKIHPKLSIHDFRMVPGTTHTNLVFDCVAPYNMEITHSQLKKEIISLIRSKYPTYYCVITIDSIYAPVNDAD